MIYRTLTVLLCFLSCAPTAQGRYLGQYSQNPYAVNSTSNPYGPYGSQYAPNSINNPYGSYGSSAVNTSNAPRLYDNNGNFRGVLNNNPYDPDSVSNPYGRYGSRYSPESINNPYGAGSQYNPNSPNNPYGNGWRIETNGY